MTRTAIAPALVCALGLLLVAAPGQAQLADVSWQETLTLSTNLETDPHLGLDNAVPEPLTGSLSGSNYGAAGSVSFAAGPPNVTCNTNANYTSGVTYLSVSTYCRIDFTFAVRQTSAPPVAVSTVPVVITVAGSCDVTGAIFASAFSEVNLANSIQGPLAAWSAGVDNSAGNDSDAFSDTNTFNFAPDLVIEGDMTASAGIAGEVLTSGTAATANAYLDPVIEVADQTIPGSSDSYRDHYQIEFAPGYWALGQAPAERTTWGRIKQLYTN